MNVCRICLSIDIYEEISRMQLTESGEKVDFADVIKFCLNLQISKNSKFTSYICIKCYNQMVTFYNFKQLALKNDKYLQSLEQSGDNETVFLNDGDVKDEKSCDNNFEVKQELDNLILEIKQERDLEAADDRIDSEDEVLSVIKQDKENDLVLEVSAKRKRGRPKKVKLDIKKESKQVCEECGKAVRNLREHSLLHKPEAERKIIQCKSCTKTFSSYSARYKHHKRKHLGLKYQCNVCDKVVSSLRNHMLIVHNPEQLPFACISCDRRFISQSVLDIHMRNHTKDKPFSCAVCEKKFKTKLLMESHKRQVHDQERSHLCQYCSKSFFKKYHLQLHLRSHTKEKPCKCEECGKYFQSTSVLRIHQRIHTGVKNYACTLCDMTFYRQGALATHMISHTKVKKYRCQYCGVPFGRSDHRNRHEKTAHLKHIIT